MKSSTSKGVEEKFNRFFNQKLSRREFIKKSIIGIGTLALGGYAFNRYVAKAVTDEYSQVFRNDAPETLWKWSKEADFYVNLPDSVQCKLCPHECRLGINDRGFCRVRVNKENKLYTIAYGNPCAVHNDPIEKKPLSHFLPGTSAFSIATAGCNLRCKNCQNWQISQFRPEDTQNADLMPEQVVEEAQKVGAHSIAYTYTEPSIFYEYMIDTAKLAKKAGLRNVWVTAGYLNEKPLRKLCKYMDAANIDLKGFTDRFYIKVTGARLKPVLNSIKILKEENVWFEVTNLIVPTLSDDETLYEEMVQWLYNNIGPNYPIHISRFHPQYKLVFLPATSIKLLHRLRDIAMNVGMNYVYIGNIPDNLNKGKDTYCPKCNKVVIERIGYTITQYHIKDGKCTFCDYKIPGVWK